MPALWKLSPYSYVVFVGCAVIEIDSSRCTTVMACSAVFVTPPSVYSMVTLVVPSVSAVSGLKLYPVALSVAPLEYVAVTIMPAGLKVSPET